jgi:hypothetical protein
MPKQRQIVRTAGSIFPGPGTFTSYYLEYRTASGFDAPWSQVLPTVLLHVAPEYMSAEDPNISLGEHPYTWLLYMRPQPDLIVGPATAGFVVGQTFQDPAGELSITVTAMDASKASVRIEIAGGSGTPTCLDGSSFLVQPKVAQTIGDITFSPNILVAGETVTASGTCTSGLAVTFTSTTPRVCTVNGSIVTAIAVGTCTVAADQVGDTVYSAAPAVSTSLDVAFGSTAPSLVVSTLADGSATNNDMLNVSGFATSVNGIQSVTINGTPVALAADGGFSFALSLQSGSNIVVTVATDDAGLATTDSRNIIRDNTPPVITGNGVALAGDVNADGKVDEADALLALQIAVKQITPTSTQLQTCDVAPLVDGVPNRDGQMNVADALVILEKSAGVGSW